MKTILFQGDSVTDAGRNYEDTYYLGTGYPHLVMAQLGYEHPGEYAFVNRGINGSRIPDIYARIVRDIIKIKPDYMSLLIGVNDYWHGVDWGGVNGTGYKRFRKVYNILLDELAEELPDMKIMIMEPFALPGVATNPTAEDPDRYKNFRKGVEGYAKICREIAEERGIKFIPLQAKFDELCKKAEPINWLIDGVHPTPMGHEMIKREWLKAFDEIK